MSDPIRQQLAFLKAIEENPADRANRLVYADWLEERGLDDEAQAQRDWVISPLKKRSEDWLRNFAEGSADLSFEELMVGAKRYVETGRYLVDGGRWEGFYTPDEFWWHYEILTGECVEESNRGNFFSCSC